MFVGFFHFLYSSKNLRCKQYNVDIEQIKKYKNENLTAQRRIF